MSVSKLARAVSDFTNTENPAANFSMWSSKIAIRDCALLSLILFLSVLLYVRKLGFYSDDWAFLSFFVASKDQSIWGLFYSAFLHGQQTYSLDPLRPVQIYYLAFLYKLFDLHPFGFHLFNSLLLCACAICFYWILREMREPRVVAFSLPLLWAMMPHYSTNRFWYIAAGSFFSQLFYFLSLFADLKSLTAKKQAFWYLRFISLLAILLSALTYEVTFPLFFLNLFVVLYMERKLHSINGTERFSKVRRFVLIGFNLITLIGLIVFKLSVAIHSGIYQQPENRMSAIIRRLFEWGSPYYGLSLRQIVQINFWNYGLNLPRTLWKMVTDYPNAMIFAGGLVILFLTAIIVYRLERQSTALDFNKRYWLRMIVLGVIVTGFGYTIFLGSTKIALTPTGIGNRVNTAAAIGASMVYLGVIGLLSTYFQSGKLRRYCFCLLVALLCASYFTVINILAGFWIKSYQEQQEILQAIQEKIPQLSDKSVVLLDGVCPYEGPAIVFESSWDLAGALQIYYHNFMLRADVISENTLVSNEGIQTSLYGWINNRYEYDENLLVFNFREKSVFKLNDVEKARQYFKIRSDSDQNCPPGVAGHGVRLF